MPPLPKKMSRAADDIGRRFFREWRPKAAEGSVTLSESGEAGGSLHQRKLNHASSSTPSDVYSDKGINEEKCVAELESFDSKESVKGISYDEEYPPLSVSVDMSSKNKPFGRSRDRVDLGLEQKIGGAESSQLERLQPLIPTDQSFESSLATNFVRQSTPDCVKGFPSVQTNYKKSIYKRKNRNDVEGLTRFGPFDICPSKDRNASSSIAHRVKESETQDEKKLTVEGCKHELLRSGMVLLKHYLTHDEQIKVVRTCRRLGIGPGGFYRPGYKDGAKLRLQMMCLGLNWDPETKYAGKRGGNGGNPPGIPRNFSVLVQRAIQDAHALIKKDSVVSNVESILPTMSPDICIVNFYTNTGRLGLHQDRDESRESIQKGLPVVSFSIGDSAEFVYGDSRDVEKAQKVILESGDVLMFGGESRLVSHGVTAIIPNSAPKPLFDATGLRPGRLNLTFRKY